MWVLPRAGRPMVTTRIFPAWNSSPDAVVYSGATIREGDFSRLRVDCHFQEMSDGTKTKIDCARLMLGSN